MVIGTNNIVINQGNEKQQIDLKYFLQNVMKRLSNPYSSVK